MNGATAKKLHGFLLAMGFVAGLPVVLVSQSLPACANTVTRTVTFTQPTFDPANPTTALVASEILEPNDQSYQLTSNFTYDAHGNRTVTAVAGSNVASRTALTTYDLTARFPCITVSAASSPPPAPQCNGSLPSANGTTQYVVYKYDPALGVLLSESHLIDSTSSAYLTTQFVYDAWGRKLYEVGPSNVGTAWTYLLCSAPTAVTGYTFDNFTSCPTNAKYAVIATPQHFSGLTPTGQNGPDTTVYYDALDRVVQKVTRAYDGTTAQYSVLDTVYDNLGRILIKYQPYWQGQSASRVVAASYLYDAFNRVTRVTAADNTTTLYAYTNPSTSNGGQCSSTTANGTSYAGCYSQVTATDQNALATVTMKNALGKPIKQIDAAGGITRYGYEAFGNLVSTTDPAGHLSTMQYNIRGWRTALVDPDRGTWAWSYDALGEVIAQTDGRGVNTFYWYDSLGRMTQRWAPDAPLNAANTGILDQWVYDTGINTLGKEVAAYRAYDDQVSGGFQWQYQRSRTYDQYQRPSVIYEQTDAKLSYAAGTQYAYDTEGRLAAEVRPSGLALYYNYATTYGFLSSVSNGAGAGYWSVGTIDAAGRVVSDQRSATFSTTRWFDPSRGFITNLVTQTASGGTTLWSEALARDAAGNVTHRTTGTSSPSFSGNVLESATYDNLYRMTSFTTAPSVGSTFTKTQTYSSDGNILSKSDVASSYQYSGVHPHAVTQVGGNSGDTYYATYSYDANGNMTQRHVVSTVSPAVYTNIGTISYDNANMTSAVYSGSNAGPSGSLVWYSYGPEGARARQVIPSGTTTRYYASGMWKEWNASGAVVQTMDYINAPTGAAAVIVVAGTGATSQYALLSDHLGSVAAVGCVSGCTSPGTIGEPRSYDAWGKMRQNSGNDDASGTVLANSSEPTGYTGQEHVKPVALVNLNARMYDPAIGRFMAADPVRANGGQGLNPYSYVGNNPLSWNDPTGLCGGLMCSLSSFINHAFGSRDAAQIVLPILSIAAVVTFQFEVFPAIAGSLGATTFVAGDSAVTGTFEAVTSFADLSPGLQALDIGLSGAIGGAINTGTLRGTIIGVATAEAFWGVGGAKSIIADELVRRGVDGVGAGAINLGAGVALHAAVGCVSSAVGGGRCGSGALSGGIGELSSSAAMKLSDGNVFVGASIVGLGGGTGSALTGGRFGDGFVIAASGYLFNDVPHRLAMMAQGATLGATFGAWVGGGCVILSGGICAAGPAEGAVSLGAAIGAVGGWISGALSDLYNGTWSNAVLSEQKTPNEGAPGSTVVNPGSGQIRVYGDDGKPILDIDSDHSHGQGVPHAHDWTPNPNGGFPTRGPGRPLRPGDPQP